VPELPPEQDAEYFFQQWFLLGEDGELPSKLEFLVDIPKELRADVSQRIDSFTELRNNLLRNTQGLIAGRVIGGYKLIQQIGSGGMGVVWEAEQLELGRRVALKLLPPLSIFSTNATARFHQEARIAAAMKHPNVVSILDSGQDDGLHWIAQELIGDGKSLADLICRGSASRRPAPPISFEALAKIFASVCDALAALHKAGVIHRDIKPSNILIDEHGNPVVSDFGMAHSDDSLCLTITGDSFGTPAFMAPEQLQQLASGITPKTDIFSLGISMYEAFCLELPFVGDTKEQISHKIVTYNPAPPNHIRPQIPRDLETLCMRALEKNPTYRPSAAQLAAELRRWLSGDLIQIAPPSLWRLTSAHIKRRPWRAAMIMVTCLAFIGGSSLLVKNRRAINSLEQALLNANNFASLWNPLELRQNNSVMHLAALQEQRELCKNEILSEKPMLQVKNLLGIGRGFLFLESHMEARKTFEYARQIVEQNPSFPEALQHDVQLFYAWSLGRTEAAYQAIPLLEDLIENPSDDEDVEVRTLWARNRLGQCLVHIAGRELKTTFKQKALQVLSALKLELEEKGMDKGNALYPLTVLDLGLAHGSADGDYVKQRQYLVQANDIYIREFGADHPERLYCLLGLAHCAYRAGDEERQFDFLERQLKLSRRLFPANAKEILLTLIIQLDYYVLANRFSSAAEMIKEIDSIDFNESVLAAVHLSQLSANRLKVKQALSSGD